MKLVVFALAVAAVLLVNVSTSVSAASSSASSSALALSALDDYDVDADASQLINFAGDVSDASANVRTVSSGGGLPHGEVNAARFALQKLPAGYQNVLQSQVEVKVAAFEAKWGPSSNKMASTDKKGGLPSKKRTFRREVPRKSRVLFKSLVFWGSNAWRYEKLEQPSQVTETMVDEALEIKDEWGDHDPHVFSRWHGILPEPTHTLPGFSDKPQRVVVSSGGSSKAQYAEAEPADEQATNADADSDADADADAASNADDFEFDEDAADAADDSAAMAQFDQGHFDTLDYEQRVAIPKKRPLKLPTTVQIDKSPTPVHPKLDYDFTGLLGDDDVVTYLAETKLTKKQKQALEKRKVGAEMLRVAHSTFSMNIRYHFGGNGKSYGGRGYDCSSWAGLVIARVTDGKHPWSRTPSSRPTTALMNTWCEKHKRWVKYEDTRVGDIVLTSRQRGGRISHVGFAAGGSFTCNREMLAKQENPKKITCGSRAGLKVIMVLHNGSYAKGLSYSFYAWTGKDRNRNLKICRPW